MYTAMLLHCSAFQGTASKVLKGPMYSTCEGVPPPSDRAGRSVNAAAPSHSCTNKGVIVGNGRASITPWYNLSHRRIEWCETVLPWWRRSLPGDGTSPMSCRRSRRCRSSPPAYPCHHRPRWWIGHAPALWGTCLAPGPFRRILRSAGARGATCPCRAPTSTP